MNGTHYVDGEAPVITMVLTNHATGAVLDHTTIAEDGTGEGCALVDANNDGEWDACPAGDGLFRTANLTVHGPRARRLPVLTTAGRAQILSGTSGPWNLSAANASLILKVDGGVAVHGTDVAGGDVMLSGNITVAVSAGTFVSTASATTDEIVAWLNANTAFNKRAIAFNQGGRVGIRSRNLGWMHSIQLATSEVATQVFAGDLAAKTPSGSYAANNVSSRTSPANNDPKVTRSSGSLTYSLDAVDDLEPGTYIVRVEFADQGNLQGVSGTSRATSVALLEFQVGSAAEEPYVANNCGTCHQSPEGTGLGIHTNKYFTDEALDTCGACHDYLPQYATSMDPATGQPRSGYGAIGWTGAKAISRRVHGVHNGSELAYPNATVDHADAPVGRNWNIGFPQDVRNCEVCHTAETSGTWHTNPNRLACSGCHDSDAATVHMRMQTLDPTPLDPWSGDEGEACAVCHAD